jgi:undecaprenyl diphosphate synthase
MNPLNHIAIIMDGNGRWAEQKKKTRDFGHKKGLDNIRPIIEFCKKKKISFLTLYVFSLDNWKRSEKEVRFLFSLIDQLFGKYTKYLIKNKIRINFIGEKTNLKKELINKIKNIQKITSEDYDTTVNLAFNYSSKLEITNALSKCIKNKKITPKIIEGNLYTANIPDPEILIRTGGLRRISDFLLWQISYTEIFFLKKFWPDFKTSDLSKILIEYHKIRRNFGAINE